MSIWDEIHEQKVRDEELSDAAVELRDTLEELMGELDKIADVEANKAVKPEQEDSFWLAGNIPATLVGRVRELISKLK